jgi:hypothetical protein
MTARREPKLDTILRAQMWLHRVAKRMRIPLSIRRAMVDVIEHTFREIYAQRRTRKRRRK